MELVAVQSRSAYFAEAWSIYESSFPPDERRTLGQQTLLFGNPSYEMLAARSGNAVVGLVSSWALSGFHFIEHLAVHEDSRGKGLGARILREFMAGRGTIIMEVERPDSVAQRRRIAFYEKAGFAMNGFDYLQPPYGPGKRPVHMLLMSHPRRLAGPEFDSARRIIHREVYGLGQPLI